MYKCPQTIQLLRHLTKIIVSPDTMALGILITENASSLSHGVCQDELQCINFPWQLQKGSIIAKLTKIQVSARTSASMATGTDLSLPPTAVDDITATYINRCLSTLRDRKCKQRTN